MADPVSGRTDISRRHAHLAEILRQQESLRSVIESISSELELRPLLTRIVFHACELLGADNGTIGLVDEARNVVRTEAAYRMPLDELGAEMPPGVGLAGEVLRTRQPVVLQHYGEIARPTQASLVQNAVIGMPILWRDRMIGFFGLGSAPPRTFHDRDVEVLSLFAKHAAIAIENARLFSGAHAALEEMHLLYETSRRISTALEIDEVVAAYLDQVAAGGHYACSVALYECDAAGENAEVLVLGRWTAGEGRVLAQARYPRSRDALDPALDAGETVTISDVHTDPRVTDALREIQRSDRRPALAMIPLMVRGERIGLVILSCPEIHVWTEEELRPYEATAAQLATAMDSRLHLKLLQQRNREVAILEVRQRLARELHDSITQLLFSITLIAQSLAPAWKREPAEAERRIERLLELSNAASAEMRALLAELRPSESDVVGAAPTASSGPARGDHRAGLLHRGPAIARVKTDGLVAALLHHIRDAARDGLRIDLEAADYVAQPAEREEAVFRIAQEALNNIIKHARARSARITLSARKQSVRLVVRDDGVGFTAVAPAPASPLSLGLTTMRERALALGGTLHVDSTPGRGTTVDLAIPGEEPDGC